MTGTSPDAPAARLSASWRANAERWSSAVRTGAIRSRRLVTDAAVTQAILRRRPASLLDLGCGEGWLCRALAPHVDHIVGLDGSPELVESARARGGAAYLRMDFADIASAVDTIGGPFDAIVANFALLDDDLAPLLLALRRIVAPAGALIVQTLHPATVAPPYRSGWREEVFDGVDGDAPWQTMPWYFRTLADWLEALAPAWRLGGIEEPLHPDTLLPASLMIVAEPR